MTVVFYKTPSKHFTPISRVFWRKKLGKLADSVFTLKSGSEVWSNFMYESLTIAFVKPLLIVPPLKAKFLPEMEGWTNSVQTVQWDGEGGILRHMRKFWS